MSLKNLSAAYTTTVGAPGVYVLQLDEVPGAKRIMDKFVAGETSTFYIGNGVDFEQFEGEYNNSPPSLIVLDLYESSNNDNPVVWGPGQKLIAATARPEDLLNMANMVESADALILRPEERQEIRIKADPFHWKSRACPLVGWGHGQSNIEPAFPVAPGSGYVLQRNANVLEWGTDGSITGPNVGVYDLRVADPTLPLKADYAFQSVDPLGEFSVTTVTTAGTFLEGDSNYHVNGRGNAPYCGYAGGQRGLATLGAAQAFQEARGGKVYFGNVAWSGQDSSKWKPGVGAAANMVDAQMPAFIARLRVLEPEFFAGSAPIPWDWLLISQGTGDLGITQPAQWATNWEETLDYWSTFTIDGSGNYTNTKWFDRRNTHIGILQRTERSKLKPWWNGQEILQQRRKNIRLFSSFGRQTAEGIHHWGNVATEWGRDAAREWMSHGRAPNDNRLELVRHADFKAQSIGRYTFAGSTANLNLDPGSGRFKFWGFSQGIAVSKVDNEGNLVDLSYLAATDLVTFSQVPNPALIYRLEFASIVEYDTHWAITTVLASPLQEISGLGTAAAPPDTTGFTYDLSTSARATIPMVKGVAKLGAAQSVAASAVVDPGLGKFAINGSHAGVVICKTGSNGTAIEADHFLPGTWIQFVKRGDPFRRYRLNILTASFAPYGDKGTWWHLQTSLASITADFDLTLDAEYIVSSSSKAAVQAVAQLAPQYKQMSAGFPESGIPPAAGSFKAFDEQGLAFYAESVSSARDRLRWWVILSEVLRLATMRFTSSLRLLVTGAKLHLSMVDQATGVIRDGITMTARSGAHPLVAINGTIYGGIGAIGNPTPEAAVSATALLITVCWNANMPSNDVVPAESTGKLQVKTAGMYEIEGLITFTGTANKTFVFGINNSFFQVKEYMGGDGAPRNIKIKAFMAFAVDDEVQLYVQSPDGATSIVISDAQLIIKRISH